MRWLLFTPLILVLGCAAPPPATPSDDQDIGLRRDRYVLPAHSDLPDPPTREERALLETQWPPVDALSLPNYTDARRVARRQPRALTTCVPAALPVCDAPGAERRPHWESTHTRRRPHWDSTHTRRRTHWDSTHTRRRTCQITPDGAVLLRAEANGYGAPRLTLTSTR